MMKRREFITLLGGAAAWPLAARAQQPERMRRIGVMMGFRENDPEGTLWLSGFTRAFQDLGWTDGRNVRMDVRWSASNVEQERRFAKETPIRRLAHFPLFQFAPSRDAGMAGSGDVLIRRSLLRHELR